MVPVPLTPIAFHISFLTLLLLHFRLTSSSYSKSDSIHQSQRLKRICMANLIELSPTAQIPIGRKLPKLQQYETEMCTKWMLTSKQAFILFLHLDLPFHHSSQSSAYLVSRPGTQIKMSTNCNIHSIQWITTSIFKFINGPMPTISQTAAPLSGWAKIASTRTGASSLASCLVFGLLRANHLTEASEPLENRFS